MVVMADTLLVNGRPSGREIIKTRAVLRIIAYTILQWRNYWLDRLH